MLTKPCVQLPRRIEGKPTKRQLFAHLILLLRHGNVGCDQAFDGFVGVAIEIPEVKARIGVSKLAVFIVDGAYGVLFRKTICNYFCLHFLIWFWFSITVIICRCGVGFPPAELSRYGKPACVSEMQPQRVRMKINPMLNNNHLTRLNSITKGVCSKKTTIIIFY